MFWSASGLPELWIASERELVGAAGRACFVFPSVRHPKRSQAPALQTWVAGLLCFGVLPACRSFGSRRSGNSWERLGGRVLCSRACVIQRGRKRASASTPNLGGGAVVFWSASGLPELWIASEPELVGAAKRVTIFGAVSRISLWWAVGGSFITKPPCKESTALLALAHLHDLHLRSSRSCGSAPEATDVSGLGN